MSAKTNALIQLSILIGGFILSNYTENFWWGIGGFVLFALLPPPSAPGNE